MFARVSTYDVPDGEEQAAKRSFGAAIDQIRQLPGFKDAVFLLACDGNRAMAITFWESNNAMNASRVAASRIRGEAARAVGGEVVSADEFEVVPLD